MAIYSPVIKNFITFLVLGGILCTAVQPLTQARAQTSTDISETITVLIFDTSGSMQDLDASQMTKLEAAQTAGENILDIISAENQVQNSNQHQVGIIDFNYYTRVDAQLSANIAIAKDALQQFAADGGTGMSDGLKTGIDMLSGVRADAKPIIILLSDGVPNIGYGNDTSIDNTVAKQQVLDQAERARQYGICIYTVGFGVPQTIGAITRENSIDEDFLRNVSAKAGCGEYYNAQNADQLADIYIRLRHVSTGMILLDQSGLISQDQDVDAGIAIVPANQAQILLTLNWPGSRLDLKITDPTGITVGPNYPGFNKITSPTTVSMIINNPQPGAWAIHVLGLDVPEGFTTYNVIMSSRIPSPQITPIWVDSIASRSMEADGLILFTFCLAAMAGILGLIFISSRNKKLVRSTSSEPEYWPQLVRSDGYIVKVSSKSFTIGRSSHNHLPISDSSVSRQHARIYFTQANWYIQDLHSSGGTYVNGRPVGSVLLNPGDQIMIGQAVFTFHL